MFTKLKYELQTCFPSFFWSQVVHVIQSFWIPWGKMTSRTTPSITREPKGESLEESLREKSCRQAGDGRFCLRPILQVVVWISFWMATFQTKRCTRKRQGNVTKTLTCLAILEKCLQKNCFASENPLYIWYIIYVYTDIIYTKTSNCKFLPSLGIQFSTWKVDQPCRKPRCRSNRPSSSWSRIKGIGDWIRVLVGILKGWFQTSTSY